MSFEFDFDNIEWSMKRNEIKSSQIIDNGIHKLEILIGKTFRRETFSIYLTILDKHNKLVKGSIHYNHNGFPFKYPEDAMIHIEKSFWRSLPMIREYFGDILK